MVGETLNERYRIERRLGGGSQAEVFLATDAHMERLVAIKIWKPEGGFTVDEFLREAKLLARFGAPHFVTIHEHSATIDDRPFFVLEYLQGETLQDLSAPLTAVEIHRCVRDVCVGLQKAHNEGIVHRDLKPSNIMVIDRGTRTERYVILDLGIAKITDTSNWRRTLADATMAGAGTLLYMSPEQCNGNPIDQRTDIYAFGCLLFMLLVQEEPFAHKTGSHLSVLNAILSDPPRRLAEVRPDGGFSEELEQLVKDCLAKKPEKRPASMTEVEARFQECLPDEVLLSAAVGGTASDASGIRTRHPGSSLTLRNRRRKRRAVAASLFASIAVATGGVAFFLTRGEPELKTPPIVKSEVKTPPREDPETKIAERANAETKTPAKAQITSAQAESKTPPRAPTEAKSPPPAQAETKPPVRSQPEPQKPVVSVAVVPAHVEQRPVVTPVAKPPVPPEVNDDRYFVVRNRTLKTDDSSGKSKDQNLYGVLANDGLPSGKPHEIECVEKPKFGELKLNRDGTFTYACAPRPGGELVRSDSFKYRVRTSERDPWSESALASIVIRPFADEEESAIKQIATTYGDAAIHSEPNPPAVQIDFSEPIVHKRIRDESLRILDGLADVVHEVHLDSQPITDNALERLGRLSELRILSLAGTDVSDAGIAKVPNLKNLSEIDLSDTLVSESAVTALAADRGQRVPLHVVRDGALDRLRGAGVAIAAKNDATLGRNGFVATIPRFDQFQKVIPTLKEAPRLVALVLSNSDVNDDLLTENLVRQLKSLRALDLRGTLVSPPRIAILKQQFPGLQLKWDTPLTQLRAMGTVKEIGPNDISVDLAQKKVDGRAWTLLSQVDKLTALNLSGVAIDDLAFERLAQLTTLRELTLQETGLTSQRVQEICRRILSLTVLDVQKSPIARDKTVLRTLLAELRSHDPAKGTLRPEPGPSFLTAPFDEATAAAARAEWADHLKTPEQIVNSIGIKLQLIPPGDFRMGSEETYLELVERFPNVREAEEENSVSRIGLESARPQHAVRVTKPYYLSVCEVTNGQFQKFIKATARKVPGLYWGIETKEHAPVVNVSWNDAVALCEWLSKEEGKTYRLPTEAEWEYACRAGSITRYWNGDEPENLTKIANVRDVTAREKFGWPNTLASSDGSAFTADVGRYPPNQFGLHDMHGNAAEWCSDWFSTLYYRQPQQADPAGPSTGALHVVRGGSWHSAAIFCRSAHRAAERSTHRSDRIGFRIACVGSKPPWPAVTVSPPAQPSGAAPASLVAPFNEEQIAAARKAWASYAHLEEQSTILGGMTMLLVPPGEFMMGSTPEQVSQLTRFDANHSKYNFKKESPSRELPLHRVRISRPFYLAAQEVTRGQFARFTRATGYKSVCERSGGKGVGFEAKTGKFKADSKYNWRNTAFTQDDTHPVVNVSWRDAAAFCSWLTWQEGKAYRLPTEAEWEYACRAGTTTSYFSGNDPESLAQFANLADETAKATFPKWHAIKARDGFVFTAPVGSLKPNAFGLFDMHGNVSEWCSDWDADDYYAKSPEADPIGPAVGTLRIFRGGGWSTTAADCRAAWRGASGPSSAGLGIGFRVAADPPSTKEP